MASFLFGFYHTLRVPFSTILSFFSILFNPVGLACLSFLAFLALVFLLLHFLFLGGALLQRIFLGRVFDATSDAFPVLKNRRSMQRIVCRQRGSHPSRYRCSSVCHAVSSRGLYDSEARRYRRLLLRPFAFSEFAVYRPTPLRSPGLFEGCNCRGSDAALSLSSAMFLMGRISGCSSDGDGFGVRWDLQVRGAVFLPRCPKRFRTPSSCSASFSVSACLFGSVFLCGFYIPC